MALWILYFLGKFFLHAQGFIALEPLPNLALYAAAYRFKGRYPSLVLAAAAGLLLWRESYFPPLWGALIYLTDPAQRPGWRYVLRFLSGYASLWAAAGLAIAIATLRFKERFPPRWTRAAHLIPAGFALLLIRGARVDAGALDRSVADFFAAQAPRRISFPSARRGPAFDVVFLHVCSLSWDDLREAGLLGDPFLKQFDYTLTRFNSVSSYSEPAAYRLLRAKCGQSRHEALEAPAPADCFLLDELTREGYRVETLLNHDGLYHGMGDGLRRWGHAPAALDVSGLPVSRLNFNGVPIVDDGAALRRWLDARDKSAPGPAALYYNTLSLHTGAHKKGEPYVWKTASAEEYRESALELFGNFTSFFEGLKNSSRATVVFFIPEHGAALAANGLQGPNLRDLPLPSITHVPVMIKIIAPGRRPGPPVSIDSPSSYFELAYLLKALLESPPAGNKPAFSPTLLAGMPQTPFLSENFHSLLIERASDVFLFWKRGKWVKLPLAAAQQG